MPRQGLGALGSRKFPRGVLRKFIRNVEKERLEIYLSPLGLNALLLNTAVTHFEGERDSLGPCYYHTAVMSYLEPEPWAVGFHVKMPFSLAPSLPWTEWQDRALLLAVSAKEARFASKQRLNYSLPPKGTCWGCSIRAGLWAGMGCILWE